MPELKHFSTLPERAYDYLYDPLYLLSSAKDHQRAGLKAQNLHGRLEKLYSFQNLFSESSAHQQYEWRLNATDPVPPSVPRDFRPVDVCKELLQIQLKDAGGYNFDEDVVGRHRAKYFTHHAFLAKTFIHGTSKAVDMAINEMTAGHEILVDNLLSPSVKQLANKAVQTRYRESEAQTEPYSPPYVVNVGETPEVLTLATLGLGKGLPAGLHDVEMIERARERRLIEIKLEPFSEIAGDPKRVAKRRKLLQDMELREWHYREREVEALQEVRMKVLVRLLRKREEYQQEIDARRLDRLWEERYVHKENRCKSIQHRYLTALRKLVRRRLAEREVSRKRDVIKEYATPSSQPFAPLTRLGVFPDRGSEKFVVKNRYLTTYEGLLELESSLTPHVLQPKLQIKPVQMHTIDGFLKREYRHLNELAQLQEYLEGAFTTDSGQARKPRYLEKIERPAARPLTPSIAAPTGDYTLENEVAAVMLQRLIRGRAIQTQMYEGKEKRRELIAELRSTHALLEDEQADKLREKLSILDTQNRYSELVHKDNQVDDVLSRLACGTLAEMLDFLSKELDRLIEERRLHALILLAERHRRMREAEESGKRQREERRRREHDEIFKQLMKVHQETVDGYLASVAGIVLETTAGATAHAEIDEVARQLDADAQSSIETMDQRRADVIAANMVHNFLIPEVNKRAHRALLAARERKFLEAAHREIWTPVHDAADERPRAMDKIPQGQDEPDSSQNSNVDQNE
ncbi:unnamed protein product [Dicrocoelium dendriticum]|nr:unnamed protein product [Dicrocoelium dendriticum]